MVDNSTVIKAYPRKSGLRTRNFDDFFEDMPRTFAEWMRPFFRDFPSLGFFEPWTSENSMVPYMDIQEADKEYNVTVDLPGVMKEDIEVKVTEDNTIEITGKRNEKKETQTTSDRSEAVITSTEVSHCLKRLTVKRLRQKSKMVFCF